MDARGAEYFSRVWIQTRKSLVLHRRIRARRRNPYLNQTPVGRRPVRRTTPRRGPLISEPWREATREMSSETRQEISLGALMNSSGSVGLHNTHSPKLAFFFSLASNLIGRGDLSYFPIAVSLIPREFNRPHAQFHFEVLMSCSVDPSRSAGSEPKRQKSSRITRFRSASSTNADPE